MADDAERLLTVPELATYLQMSDRTVLKLAAEGTLPGARIGNQWRFKRSVIDEWLEEQMGAHPDDHDDAALAELHDAAGVPLSDFLSEGSIVPDLKARDALGAIEGLVAQAHSQGWLKDKAWFIGAVVEREALASTAMEGGVAFLHTRQQNARKISRPFIVFGRCHEGIDFGAPDGKPTHLFFLLGLKYDRLHLPILGRLARILQNQQVVRTLRGAPTLTRIRDTLLQEDMRALRASRGGAAKAQTRKRGG